MAAQRAELEAMKLQLQRQLEASSKSSADSLPAPAQSLPGVPEKAPTGESQGGQDPTQQANEPGTAALATPKGPPLPAPVDELATTTEAGVSSGATDGPAQAIETLKDFICCLK